MISFLALIAGAISVALGLIVVAEGTNTRSMRIAYGMFAGSVGLWAIFLGLFLTLPPNLLTSLIVIFYYSIGVLIPYAFLLFSLAYLSIPISLKVRLFALLPWVAMTILIATPGVMIGAIDAGSAKTVELVFSTYLLYSSLFIVYVAMGLWFLITKAARAKGVLAHRRVVAVSLFIGFAGGGFFDIILPLFGNYSLIAYGPLFAFVTSAGIFYVIAKHGLFDIRLAVVRTSAYILSIVSLAGIYLFITYFVFDVLLNNTTGFSEAVVNVSLTLLLAFLFQPIKRFFDHITNTIFYRDSYSIDEFFARLNRTLTSTTDLYRLMQVTAKEVSQTLKSEQAFFLIFTGDDHFVTGGTDAHSRIPKEDVRQLSNLNVNNHAVVATSALKSDDPIKRMLLSHKVELVLPLQQANVTVGYLFLGAHKTSAYVSRDIRVLGTVSDELVIAIQNALSIQEVRELNATLQQRVNEATKELRASNTQLQRLDKAKDEFVSVASHQLRTPLTSVKGYISMVMEGDAGKISDAQKHLLGEAFTSSERMVHLINDFLNVSRLQTGKFLIEKRPVDLAKVVEQELDSLMTNATARKLSFQYKKPKAFPLLNIDEGKIRQVIMNFSDNALYYSHENTKISVDLVIDKDNVVFTVKDTGIGVPQAEQSQLFTKFYRASNARKQRPDGTGVGLFLAKKVIDAHGGQVVFTSREGKGSTFGFSLPINELAVSDTDDLKDQDNQN